MKKYIIAVGSEEISREVQEALFRAGFSWGNGGKRVQHTHGQILLLNSYGNGELLYNCDSSTADKDIKREGHLLVTSQEVIADPFQLDGDTKPAKDMTMEDLEEHFGEPIKITKKK